MEPTACYFACKKACEPIHIQWNAVTNKVKVINNTSKELKGLKAEATIYNLDGSVVQTKCAQVDCAPNSASECMTLFVPGEDKIDSLSNVHFIHLTLKDGSGALPSTNFYWRSKAEWKYEDMKSMNVVTLDAKAGELKDGKLTVDLVNPTAKVVLAARLKVVDLETGHLAAPVIYADNYISLAPQESRRVEISFKAVRTSHTMKLYLEGWNVKPAELVELHQEQARPTR